MEFTWRYIRWNSLLNEYYVLLDVSYLTVYNFALLCLRWVYTFGVIILGVDIQRHSLFILLSHANLPVINTKYELAYRDGGSTGDFEYITYMFWLLIDGIYSGDKS